MVATRRQLRVLEFAQSLLRGCGFLAVVIVGYDLLHGAGLWNPESPRGYWWVALICAGSLALRRRFPVVQLVGVSVLVGNPWWFFPVGEFRAVPLVIAAFLAASAGLRVVVALPIVVIAALSGECPRWVEVIAHPSAWSQFVVQNGMSLPLLIVVLVIAAVLVGHASFVQRRNADSLHAKNEELARLRDVERERIADEERAAIAREIHDVVAHHLAAIVVRAQAAASVAESCPDEMRATVEWISEVGPQALAEMRSVVQVLRGTDTGKIGAAGRGPALPQTLAVAIDDTLDRVRAAGLDVRADIRVPAGMSAVQEFAVLRVCQEALTNVLVHSDASGVEVRLDEVEGETVLTVEDDGAAALKKRQAPELRAAGHGGSGIPGMRERARAVGGTVTAGRSARGWRVQLVMPRQAASVEPLLLSALAQP